MQGAVAVGSSELWRRPTRQTTAHAWRPRRSLGCSSARSISCASVGEEWRIAKVLARDSRGRPSRVVYPKALLRVLFRPKPEPGEAGCTCLTEVLHPGVCRCGMWTAGAKRAGQLKVSFWLPRTLCGTLSSRRPGRGCPFACCSCLTLSCAYLPNGTQEEPISAKQSEASERPVLSDAARWFSLRHRDLVLVLHEGPRAADQGEHRHHRPRRGQAVPRGRLAEHPTARAQRLTRQQRHDRGCARTVRSRRDRSRPAGTSRDAWGRFVMRSGPSRSPS